MNTDINNPLPQAFWPTVIANDLGTVLSHNSAALRCFGPGITGEKFSLKDLWDPANPGGYRMMLQQLRPDNSEPLMARFKLREGGTALFLCVTAVTEDGFFIQFMPLVDAPPKATSETPAPVVAPEEDSGLLQKQKLECALKLIQSVALDFNNALTGILGHTSLILGRMKPGDPWHASLKEILKSVEKAAEIAFDLAAFSQQEQEAHLQLAGDVNQIIRRTVEIYQSQDYPGIRWKLQLGSRLHSVKLEEVKMQQAIMKILDNGIQSMDSRGTLIVNTRNLNLKQPLEEGATTVPQGRYVQIEFEDSGRGIDPADMPRIFDPFFTTKANHRGLGLAWVYGIVSNHAGRVSVQSSPGEGAVVRVYLPAAQKLIAEVVADDPDLRGHQTILMVDDEELLLTMGKTVLTSFGYTVMEANNGEEALRIYQKQPQKIDLVITDMVMPDMNGHELVRHVREVDSRQKILCVSGYYQSNATPIEGLFLQKPFTSQGLLQKVREVLAD